MINNFYKYTGTIFTFTLILCSFLYGISNHKIQENIVFSDIIIPLEKYDVKDRIETILGNLITDRRNYMQSLIDKQYQFIPIAKEILSEHGLNTDFAYIIPVESDFNLRALSESKASGPWQLMPATARMYGLRVDDQVDERNLLITSTTASAEHISHLMKVFDNDVFLVLAAFNNGEGNVASMLETQNSNNFWECVSNSETDLYVPKVIAYKMILSDPVKYGFKIVDISNDKIFEPCMISLEQKDLQYTEICSLLNLSYREFYDANPHLKFSYKNKNYISKFTTMEIMVPENSKSFFIKSLEDLGYINFNNIADEMNTSKSLKYIDNYIVENNDNIESIAFRYGISWEEIAKINDLEIIKLDSGIETAKVYPGQKLVIER
ncbi:MAG: transglycosylase SLT domain-containing protein [Candidatus Delongbacteria bacterium]|nr:transglycosylase SLT domain-containing protein [Candidatus Delongbacteria bacterium]